MNPVSHKLRNAMTEAVGDSSYFNGIKKDIEIARAVEEGMGTIFGAAIFQALEEVERAAFHTMSNVSPHKIDEQVRARAELKVAQYIKSRLSARVMNVDAMIANLNELGPEERE